MFHVSKIICIFVGEHGKLFLQLRQAYSADILNITKHIINSQNLFSKELIRTDN